MLHVSPCCNSSCSSNSNLHAHAGVLLASKLSINTAIQRRLTLANVFFSHLLCSSGDASTNSLTCLRTFSKVLSSCFSSVSSFPPALAMSAEYADEKTMLCLVLGYNAVTIPAEACETLTKNVPDDVTLYSTAARNDV